MNGSKNEILVFISRRQTFLAAFGGSAVDVDFLFPAAVFETETRHHVEVFREVTVAIEKFPGPCVSGEQVQVTQILREKSRAP